MFVGEWTQFKWNSSQNRGRCKFQGIVLVFRWTQRDRSGFPLPPDRIFFCVAWVSGWLENWELKKYPTEKIVIRMRRKIFLHAVSSGGVGRAVSRIPAPPLRNRALSRAGFTCQRQSRVRQGWRVSWIGPMPVQVPGIILTHSSGVGKWRGKNAAFWGPRINSELVSLDSPKFGLQWVRAAQSKSTVGAGFGLGGSVECRASNLSKVTRRGMVGNDQVSTPHRNRPVRACTEIQR